MQTVIGWPAGATPALPLVPLSRWRHPAPPARAAVPAPAAAGEGGPEGCLGEDGRSLWWRVNALLCATAAKRAAPFCTLFACVPVDQLTSPPPPNAPVYLCSLTCPIFSGSGVGCLHEILLLMLQHHRHLAGLPAQPRPTWWRSEQRYMPHGALDQPMAGPAHVGRWRAMAGALRPWNQQR